MKKILVLILLTFLSSSFLFAQQKLTETEKLASTGKLWGFLKYYHPEVAKGTFNWDKQLIEVLPEVEQATTKEQLSEVYLKWIASLGKVKKTNTKSGDDYFEKNFNLSWISDSTIFTPELSQKLRFIENNRNKRGNHYVSTRKYVGNVIITNEPEYKNFEYPDKHYRLLCLFRYWNIIEYFFPYKYQTDQNWNDVLLEMIPRFRDAKSATEYHLAILETVVKIDDGHTLPIYTKKLATFFGKYWIPINYAVIDNSIVISGFRYKGVDKRYDLKVGDAILEIDGISIAELLQQNSKYTPASHQNGKEKRSSIILRGHKPEVTITYKRNGKIFEKTIHRDDVSTFKKIEPVARDKTKWKQLSKNIAYVNLGNVETSEVDQIMDSVTTCSKAIIFDIRNRPKGTRVMRRISVRLKPQSDVFAKIIVPDLSYPGKFRWKEGVESGIRNKNYYKGKVILLVNGHTLSHGEYFTMCLQSSPNAITIGQQTAGADGNVSQFKLIGGFKTAMSGTGIFYPDGTETQRKGVKIDIEVEPTIAVVIENRDEILEKAIEVAKD
ncbi:S41 family peptidase [Sunxiuqinia elliptica]|uniref:Peptidase family S41 n=1 Tax=Sunxiuqinia elliptica TaxID=655355 RepID=A0A1I2EZ26_9BACT|nr:S41 family peptidase [Sunxiuqinia elliptica]SFE97541.1 Peptidase family S41 [Sunxiuqinia elliptica]